MYLPLYETPDQGIGDNAVTYDFQTGIYLTQMDIAHGAIEPVSQRQPQRAFSGDALAAEGLR
jgi:hypothetical protein